MAEFKEQFYKLMDSIIRRLLDTDAFTLGLKIGIGTADVSWPCGCSATRCQRGTLRFYWSGCQI